MMTKERNQLKLTVVEPPIEKKPHFENSPPNFFDFEQTAINGEKIIMSKFKGKKAFLVVNVASECQNSPDNYEWMAKMIQKYPDLQIILYPCNQFLETEKGTADQILEF